jgi:hypothetical protein
MMHEVELDILAVHAGDSEAGSCEGVRMSAPVDLLAQAFASKIANEAILVRRLETASPPSVEGMLRSEPSI